MAGNRSLIVMMLVFAKVRMVGRVKVNSAFAWNTPLVKTCKVAMTVPPFVPLAVNANVCEPAVPLAVNGP